MIPFNLILKTVTGSSTLNPCEFGSIHVGPSQTVTVQQLVFSVPFHFHVYEKGELQLPSSCLLLNTHNSMNGTLSRVQDLNIAGGTLTYNKPPQTLVSVPKTEMRLYFNSLTIKSGAKIRLLGDWKYVITTGNFTLESLGEIKGSNVTVNATNFQIEEGGHFNLDSQSKIHSGQGKVRISLNDIYIFKCITTI